MEPLLAVFVAKYEDQLQVYNMKGRWAHIPKGKAAYKTSNFISVQEVEALKPYLPDGPIDASLVDEAQMIDRSVPRAIGGPVVSKLLQFYKEAEDIYRKHANVFDNVYKTISHPIDLKPMTLDRIAAKLLQKNEGDLTNSEKYAVRKALLHGGIGIHTDNSSYFETSTHFVHPTKKTNTLYKVQRWIRAYQDYFSRHLNDKTAEKAMDLDAMKIHNFIKKAKSLISKSRQFRPETDCCNVGPLRNKTQLDKAATKKIGGLEFIEPVSFSPADKDIILFLHEWAVTKTLHLGPAFASSAKYLLGSLDAYGKENVDVWTGQVLLQEIGALLPFEYRGLYDYTVTLPIMGLSSSQKRLNDKIDHKDRDHGYEQLPDRLKSLRKDWGPMNVYCIDSAGTVDIDDGLSIERVAGSKAEYWVHIHVANPSAFFGPNHPLGQFAEHLTSTYYYPDKVYNMLPPNVTSSLFSLGSKKATLTFSGKLNEAGQLLDYKISPGRLREVIKLTPQEALAYTTGISAKPSGKEYSIGGKISAPERKASHLNNEQVEELKILHLLAGARLRRRLKAGGRSWDLKDIDITVRAPDQSMLPFITRERSRSLYCVSDPIIRVKTNGFQYPYGSSDNLNADLVAEHMLLAGEIAGRWCSDRKVPAIYRGTLPNPLQLDERTYQEEIMRPYRTMKGAVKFSEAQKYIKHAYATVGSTRPLPHMHMGLEVMTRATSPIRRYTDLLLHWQIGEVLRHEARMESNGRKENSASPPLQLPFDEPTLTQLIGRLTPCIRRVFSSQATAGRHWVTQFMMRAHHFGECELPATYRFVVLRMKRLSDFVHGYVQDFGFEASMALPDAGDDVEEAQVGDVWEVRLQEIDCYSRIVRFKAVTLLERDPLV